MHSINGNSTPTDNNPHPDCATDLLNLQHELGVTDDRPSKRARLFQQAAAQPDDSVEFAIERQRNPHFRNALNNKSTVFGIRNYSNACYVNASLQTAVQYICMNSCVYVGLVS